MTFFQWLDAVLNYKPVALHPRLRTTPVRKIS